MIRAVLGTNILVSAAIKKSQLPRNGRSPLVIVFVSALQDDG